MTQTAKFNIGGQIYQVSRSLLEQYPDTMLSKSASTRWQGDPESEIFIERNGGRFQYILDYLRDGKVSLPITQSKNAIINEFEYYGIVFDESKIDDIKERRMISLSSMKECLSSLKEYAMEVRDVAYSAEVESHTVPILQFFVW